MAESRKKRRNLSILGVFWLVTVAAVGQESSALRAVREIEDPSSGLRWYLLRDPMHPGAPGRLTPFPIHGDLAAQALVEPLSRPIVLAGDRLIVEDRTAVLSAHLEAVALRPAHKGQVIEARLTGKAIRVQILGAGRARLVGIAEVKQ
jgi:hypothetical protein